MPLSNVRTIPLVGQSARPFVRGTAFGPPVGHCVGPYVSIKIKKCSFINSYKFES